MAKTFTLDHFLRDDSQFKLGLELERSDEEIRDYIATTNPSQEPPSFLRGIFAGNLYLSVCGSDVLGSEGLYHSPLYHINEMFGRSGGYLGEDFSKYSLSEDPVLLLDNQDNSKELMDWLNAHTISARCASIYPKMTLVRKGDLMVFNYYTNTRTKLETSSVEVGEFVRGLQKLAQGLKEWSFEVQLPPAEPLYQEFIRNIKKAGKLTPSCF